MHNIVLRVVDHNDRLTKIAISSIAFVGSASKTDLPKTEEKRFLKCVRCKHHDFKDGIAINHYECADCGTGYQVWNA